MKTTAIQQMTAEHRHIETVIQFLQGAVAALEQPKSLPVGPLREAVEFLRVYADQRHHQREEALFFPLLVKRGVPPQGCPIGGLNNDHAKGRAFASALEEKISAYEQQQPGAAAALRQTLQEVIQLYRHHLWMEDAMVFPMAERLLSEADNQELLARFADLDRALGPETVARWEQFATRLAAPANAPGGA